MAGFSIDAALKSGFRLAKREWGAVLVWGVGYLLFSLAIQLISIGGALPEYIRMMGQDAEAATAVLEQRAEAQALVTLPLMMILGLLVTAVFYGAVARAMLQPEDRRFFYLRFGKAELWLLLTSLALGTLAVCAFIAVGAAVAALSGFLAELTGGPVLLWSVLLAIPAVVGFAYVGARFSMAWVQAFAEQRFVLLDSWRLTRGNGWRILLMLLALFFLLIIVSLVVMIPLAIVAMILLAVAGMAGGVAAAVVGVLVGIAALVGFSLYNGVIYTAMAAPYVEIYRSLKGVGLPGGETAEVFA